MNFNHDNYLGNRFTSFNSRNYLTTLLLIIITKLYSYEDFLKYSNLLIFLSYFLSVHSGWRSEPFTYHRPGRVCESQRGPAAVGDRQHTAGDTIRPEASPTQGPPADAAAQGLPGAHHLPCGHRGTCATGAELPGRPIHHSNCVEDSSPASQEAPCAHAPGCGSGPRTRRQWFLRGIGGGPL